MLITNTMWTHSNQKSVLALQLFNIQYFVASLGKKKQYSSDFHKKIKAYTLKHLFCSACSIIPQFKQYL